MTTPRRAALISAAVLGATLLAGCGDKSITLPSRPTGSVTLPTRPTTSAPATKTSAPETTTAKPEPTKSTTVPPKTTAPPTTTAAATTTSAATKTVTATRTVTVTVTATPVPNDDGSSTPWWPFALVGVVLLALVGWLLVRASRRRGWDTRFDNALVEARWVSSALTDSLASQTLSADTMTLYWNESGPRVDRLKTELTALIESTSDERRKARAVRLSTDVASLTDAMQAHVDLRGALSTTLGNDVSLAQSRSVLETRRRVLQDAIDDRPATGTTTTPGPNEPPPPPPPPGWSG